ncbi:MAG TPA: ABC transporter permease [Symbiobacteriaceae bacterium]|nr:ABC transporter permease [Symbiobacteriaceae bacterium]
MIAKKETPTAATEPKATTPWVRFRRNKLAVAGLVVIIGLVLLAIFAPWIAPADPNRQDLLAKFAAPGTPMRASMGGSTYLFGADSLGRDLLSRTIWGARISLMVGVVSETLIVLIGVTMGSLAGYYGRWVDQVISRLCEILFAFPDLLFAIAMMFALGSGLLNLFITLAVISWAGMARLVRSQVLQLKEREYVQAAKAAGAKDWWVILRHILPNAIGPIIVSATLGVPGAIMAEASLSFLGLGVKPPTATWGYMIYDGRQYLMSNPLVSVIPGVAVMLTVLAFNLFGDGLRDAFDPRAKQKGA